MPDQKTAEKVRDLAQRSMWSVSESGWLGKFDLQIDIAALQPGILAAAKTNPASEKKLRAFAATRDDEGLREVVD